MFNKKQKVSAKQKQELQKFINVNEDVKKFFLFLEEKYNFEVEEKETLKQVFRYLDDIVSVVSKFK
jgi:hypothetical protein